MKLWLLIALALTVQEGLSTLAVLIKAHQLHYSLVIISLIWLAVTVLQILFGYFLGKRIQERFRGTKFEKWVEKNAHRLEKAIDKNGEKLALVIFASAISPGVGAFVASWLDISFANIFFYSLLGDLFWYLSTLATVFGAVELLSRAKEGLVILIVIAIAVVLFSHFRKSKIV